MKSTSYQHLCLLSLTLVLFSAGGFAQDAKKKAPPAAKKSEWSIPWLKNTTIDTPTDVIKRFGRLQRNDIWDPPAGYSIGGIDYLGKQVLLLDEDKFDSDETKNNIRKLKSYAYFYKARSLGNQANSRNPTDEDLGKIIEDLKKAVDLGYSNHREILGAEKELHHVFKQPKFVAMIDQLAKDANKRIRENFPKKIDAGFTLYAKAEKKAWKPDIKTRGSGEAFWPAGAASIVVLCRIHHDGYNKFIGPLEKITDARGMGGALRTLFYQFKADDQARLKQTDEYVAKLKEKDPGISSPYAVIDRGQYKALRDTLKGRFDDGSTKSGNKNAVFDIFQPAIIFFDADGVPLYLTNGVLESWQIENVLTRFATATGSGAPVKKPAPAEVKTPEKPAEKPAEKPTEPPPAETGKEEESGSSDN